jgi:photosystem II stability/assembly factor-like uncharacterized protein
VLLTLGVHGQGWKWSSVPVGGGGYVIGLLFHPAEKDLIYSRTDVGGIYRFQNNTWEPLTERFNASQKNLYGGESIAIDPQNPDVIYHAAGMYEIWGTGDVFKSSDRGRTWTSLGLHLFMGGNQNYRWGGERLAVDPQNSDILYFGSRYNGLWRYIKGSWSYVSSLGVNGTEALGVIFVIFDPAVKGTQTKVIYAGVINDGVYKSEDGGNTWSHIASSPKFPVRAALATDSSLYVTAGDGVYRILPDNTVKNITPPNTDGCDYSAIAVDPVNSNTVLTGQHCNAFWCSVWVSNNGGQTWDFLINRKEENHSPHQANVPWWPADFFSSATAHVAIDPFNRTRLFLTDWFGTWITDDYTAKTPSWRTAERGHEEVFGIVLHCPVTGSLLSGTADVDGFKHGSMSEYPKQFTGLGIQDTTSIDSSDLHPDIVVRAGTINWSNTGGAGLSKDGGVTWSAFPKYPVTNNYPLGGEVAISTDTTVIVWRPFSEYAYYTTNGGATWTMSKGSPKSPDNCCHIGPLGIDAAYNTLMVADRGTDKTFYIYDKGNFYVSTDGAMSFTIISQIPGYKADNHVMVVSTPGKAGNLWASLDNNGLWRTQDGGKTWKQISVVQQSLLIALGKSKSTDSPQPLYIMGKVNDINGIFAITNYDNPLENIINIQDPKMPIGDNPWSMCADKQIYGQVYIGTLGRGIYFSQPQ